MSRAEVAVRRRSRGQLAATSAPPTERSGSCHRAAASTRWSSGQTGAVTAEAAVVIPVLLALVLGSVWVVALAVTKVRVVDAAREVARVAARGESDGSAVAQGRQVAPTDTRFSVRRSGGQVVVTATVAVRGPGGLFGFLPAVSVESQAVAVEEPR